jgi:hypothetical protein
MDSTAALFWTLEQLCPGGRQYLIRKVVAACFLSYGTERAERNARD